MPPSLGPIDRWFNKSFPPKSWRRLLFGLAALPMVGLAVALVQRITRGEPFSLEVHLFATLVGAAILALVWFGVVMKQDLRSASSADERQAERPAPRSRHSLHGFSFNEFLAVGAILFFDMTLFQLIADLGISAAYAIAISAPAAVLASLADRFGHRLPVLPPLLVGAAQGGTGQELTQGSPLGPVDRRFDPHPVNGGLAALHRGVKALSP